MAITGHLRDCEWFGSPYELDCILVLHTPMWHTVISTFANGVKIWDVEMTKWNNNNVLCWLCTDANEAKEKTKRKIIESRTCIVPVYGFSPCLWAAKLTSPWHLYKCRTPLRISSVLLWIDLNMKSKPGNDRQTSWLIMLSPKSLKSWWYLVRRVAYS